MTLPGDSSASMSSLCGSVCHPGLSECELPAPVLTLLSQALVISTGLELDGPQSGPRQEALFREPFPDSLEPT